MGRSVYRLAGPCMNGLDLRTGRTVRRIFWVTGLARWEISGSGLVRWQISGSRLARWQISGGGLARWQISAARPPLGRGLLFLRRRRQREEAGAA